VTYPAIAWLERRLHSGMRGFEYGSGGSTLFFARRVGEITAAEHHAGWAERVREAAEEERLGNVRVLHRPADERAPSGDVYISRHVGHRGVSYERYARSIEGFDDGSLDFVFVDGRSRVACVAHAAPKVRPGGYLILDNAERGRYEAAHRLMAGHRRLVLKGVGPRVPWRFETVVWRIGR
jgi:predicted O-methyltransferase YrrM